MHLLQFQTDRLILHQLFFPRKHHHSEIIILPNDSFSLGGNEDGECDIAGQMAAKWETTVGFLFLTDQTETFWRASVRFAVVIMHDADMYSAARARQIKIAWEQSIGTSFCMRPVYRTVGYPSDVTH